jgi:hypothetical protein
MKILDKLNYLALVPAVYAAETIDINPPSNITGAENLSDITVSSLISGLISLVFIVASLIFFFMLVLGGIKWMTAGGDKDKAGEARSQLTSALIGLVVIFLAWAISSLLENLFGINVLGEFTIPRFFNGN